MTAIKQRFDHAEIMDHRGTLQKEDWGTSQGYNLVSFKDIPAGGPVARAGRWGAYCPPCFAEGTEPSPAAARWNSPLDPRGALTLRVYAHDAKACDYLRTKKDTSSGVPEFIKDGSERDLWEIVKEAWRTKNGVDPVLHQGALYFYESDLGYWRTFSDAMLNTLIWVILDGLHEIRLTAQSVRSIIKHAELDGLIEDEIDDPWEAETPGVLMLTALEPGKSLESGLKQLRIHAPHRDGTVRYICPESQTRKRHTFATENSGLAELVPALDHCPNVPVWEDYLSSLFEGDRDAAAKVDVIESFLGACMAGLAPRFAKCMVWEGEGSNGKSLLIEVIRKLLFKPDQVCVSTPATWDKFGIGDLDGPLINLVSELDEQNVFKGAAFKAAVTGDYLRGEYKGGRSFKFKPRAGNIFSCNSRPATTDTSLGMRRRFIFIRFPLNFNDRVDHKFGEDILGPLEDVAHLIRARLVWKAAELLKRGHYTPIESSIESVNEWSNTNDAVKDYAISCLIPCPTNPIDAYPYAAGTEKPGDLNADFVKFCRNTNRPNPYSNREFYRRLEAIGVERSAKPSNGHRVFNCQRLPRVDWLEGSKDLG